MSSGSSSTTVANCERNHEHLAIAGVVRAVTMAGKPVSRRIPLTTQAAEDACIEAKKLPRVDAKCS